MTLPAKKFDRYLMPTFLVLDVVAGPRLDCHRTVGVPRSSRAHADGLADRWQRGLERSPWDWCCCMVC